MRKIIYLFLFLCFVSTSIFAQTRTITGKVTDENGKPLSNASIIIKGTSKGTTSDVNGNFNLVVPVSSKVIVVSSVNFVPQEVAIANKTNVTVGLIISATDLNAVVITGYGSQKKNNLTSSVGYVNGKAVENTPMSSVDEMLQGKVAGLQSSASTGQVGANQMIRIRGAGSFGLGSSQPLYVVDGIQINGGDLDNGNGGGFNINPSTNVLATLNSDDVETISVLKDAAATSIYGARGSNGVIIITTKSGKPGKTQFRFDTEV